VALAVAELEAVEVEDVELEEELLQAAARPVQAMASRATRGAFFLANRVIIPRT